MDDCLLENLAERCFGPDSSQDTHSVKGLPPRSCARCALQLLGAGRGTGADGARLDDGHRHLQARSRLLRNSHRRGASKRFVTTLTSPHTRPRAGGNKGVQRCARSAS